MSEDTYICAAGDTFDFIALLRYGHERHTFHLLIANPQYSHKLVFDGGEELVIPEVEDAQQDEGEAPPATSRPPWKR